MTGISPSSHSLAPFYYPIIHSGLCGLLLLSNHLHGWLAALRIACLVKEIKSPIICNRSEWTTQPPPILIKRIKNSTTTTFILLAKSLKFNHGLTLSRGYWSQSRHQQPILLCVGGSRELKCEVVKSNPSKWMMRASTFSTLSPTHHSTTYHNLCS